MKNGRLQFLGTGGSMGIPVVGCSCAVCQSELSKNKRLRPSALLTFREKKILIDAGPDFRIQALRYGIDTLDGVIITHAHHDHTAGIDELRVYYMRNKIPLPCLVSAFTAEDLKIRYAYMFDTTNEHKLVTRIEFQVLEGDRGVVDFAGLRIGYVTFDQAGMPVNGYRFGDLAFISDIKEFSDEIYDDIQGVETLVLSALRFEASALHFSIDEAVAFAERVSAKKTWLTHVAHEVDHEKANAKLPPNIQLAYDGLEIDFQTETV